MRATLIAIIIATSLLLQASAYKYGDPVPMAKRSQYKGVRKAIRSDHAQQVNQESVFVCATSTYPHSMLCVCFPLVLCPQFRTEWSEVVAAEAPKFGLEKTVRLNPLTDAKEYLTNEEFKLSFSFSGDRLIVPWITITDGKAHYVQAIDFTFMYAQGYINHVKWQASYYADTTNKPEVCMFRYHWQEVLEIDPAFGMNTVLVVTSVIAWLAVVLVLLEYDGRPAPRKATTAAAAGARPSHPTRPAGPASTNASWDEQHQS